MELSQDWHKRTNVRLMDILSDIMKEPRPPKVPKPTHGYTIAETKPDGRPNPEVVTAPGVYFPAKKGNVIPLESRQGGGEVSPGGQPPDWKSLFTPEMEQNFQSWYAERAKNMGLNPNPDDPRHFYDTRGAWLKGHRSTTEHLPDTYKLPGHPSFSDQSIYYRPGMKAGRWEGGKHIPSESRPSLSDFNPKKPKLDLSISNQGLSPYEKYRIAGMPEFNQNKEISQSHSIPLGGKRGELNLSTTDEDSDFMAKWNIPISTEAGSTIPLVPKQEGGEVNPSLFKETSLVNLGASTQQGIEAGHNTSLLKSTPIHVSPWVSNLESLEPKPLPLTSTSLASYAPQRNANEDTDTATPPPPPKASSPELTPPPFSENTRSPVFGSDQLAAYNKKYGIAQAPDLYERLKAASGAPGMTPLLSRKEGGAVSPDPDEGLTEEERKRRALLKSTGVSQEAVDAAARDPMGVSLETPKEKGQTAPVATLATEALSKWKPPNWQSVFVPEAKYREKALREMVTPKAGEQPPGAAVTKKMGEEKIGDMELAKPEAKPLPTGNLSDINKEVLPSGETRYSIRGAEDQGGITTPKGWVRPTQEGALETLRPTLERGEKTRREEALASLGPKPTYYDVHPEERIMDLAREETKPSIDAIDKSLGYYRNIIQGYGTGPMGPKAAMRLREEASKQIPILEAEKARLTGTTAGIPEKIFGSEEAAVARAAGGRAAPETQITLAKGAVEEDLKRRGIDRPASKQEVLDKILQVKKSSMSGFDTQDEAIQSAKELWVGMGSPEGFVPSAKMGTGNKWVPQVINPNIASVSMEQVKSPEFQNSLKLQAEMWLRGGGEPRFTGFGGSIAMMEFYKIAGQMAKERGMSSQEIIANQMVLKGQKEATAGLIKLRENSGAFEGMVDRNIKLMTNISKNLDRTQIPILNDVLRTGQIKLLSDPNAIKLYDAVQTVVTEYARMMGSMGIGGAVIQNEQRAIANKFIEAGFTTEALIDVSNFLKAEMKNKLDALDTSVKGSVGQIPSLPGEPTNVRPGGAGRPPISGGNIAGGAAAPTVMTEQAARAALTAKGVTGPEQDNWINQYKNAGKVQ